MKNTKLTRRGVLASGAGLGAAAMLGGGTLAAPVSTRRGLSAKFQDEITLNVFVHANHPFDMVKPIFEAKYPNVKLNMMEQNDVAIPSSMNPDGSESAASKRADSLAE